MSVSAPVSSSRRFTVHGILTTHNGYPVVNEKIRLLSKRKHLFSSAYTDAQGHFSLPFRTKHHARKLLVLNYEGEDYFYRLKLPKKENEEPKLVPDFLKNGIHNPNQAFIPNSEIPYRVTAYLRYKEKEGVPLANQKVAVYDADSNKLLVITQSDRNGNVHFMLDKRVGGHKLLFQVYEEKLKSQGDGEWKVKEMELDLTYAPSDVNLGVIVADPIPHPLTPAFKIHLAEAGWDNVLKKGLVSFLSLFGNRLNASLVQKIFGKRSPDLEITPENTLDMLLNGIYPADFEKGVQENEMVCRILWDRFEFDNSAELPNTELVLEKSGEALRVKEVRLSFRDDAAEMKSYNPEHPDFKRALYLFNSMAFLRGEIGNHLGIGHFMTGHIAEGVNMFLKKHPLGKFLKPHLDGVQMINKFSLRDFIGTEFIIRKGSTIDASGLSSQGIQEVIGDTLGRLDWKAYQPREPINSQHRFAQAKQLFFELARQAVHEFFAENKRQIRSKEHWHEIYELSRFLSIYSAPYVQPEGDWIDSKEFGKTGYEGRVSHMGMVRSFREITTNKEKPNPSDVENLKQFCTYTLSLVFYDWVLHESQARLATNLKFASLTPQYKGFGELVGTCTQATEKLLIALGKTDFQPTPLIHHPRVNQGLKDKLLQQKEAFAKLGYDITRLPYGVVI